jgi:hypothetical protein
MSVPVPGGSGMISLTLRCGQLWASVFGMDPASANAVARTSRTTRGAERTIVRMTISGCRPSFTAFFRTDNTQIGV